LLHPPHRLGGGPGPPLYRARPPFGPPQSGGPRADQVLGEPGALFALHRHAAQTRLLVLVATIDAAWIVAAIGCGEAWRRQGRLLLHGLGMGLRRGEQQSLPDPAPASRKAARQTRRKGG